MADLTMLNPCSGLPTAVPTAWDVIEEACIAQITGELTLLTEASHSTRVYISNGLVYFAEHDGDDDLAMRLVAAGVIGHEQLLRGSFRVNGAEYLGWLFQRDTTIDRDSVELAVEMITEQTLADVAEEPVESFRTVHSRQHPTGIARWFSSNQTIDDETASVPAVYEPVALWPIYDELAPWPATVAQPTVAASRSWHHESSKPAAPNRVLDLRSIPVPEDVLAAVHRALAAIEAATAPLGGAASVTLGPLHAMTPDRSTPFSFAAHDELTNLPESTNIPDDVATEVSETPQPQATGSARRSALRRLIDGIRHPG